LEDPNVWILNLESIRARLADMKAGITDEDFMVHVLNGLPKEYEVQVSKLEERFGSTSNPLTIKDMRSELNLKFACLKRQSEEQSETDQVLAAFCRFKGKCSNCGKYGHKSSECHSKMMMTKSENGEGRKQKKGKTMDKSHIKCYNCGKMGHYKSKCPNDTSKKATTKTTEKQNDTVLMTIDGAAKPKNAMWIADSAASTHIVNSEKGLYNVKNIKEPVKIGDGKLVYATKVGKL